MQHIIIALTLIIFFKQSTLFPMDPPPAYKKVQQTNTGLSEDQMVTRIDQAIDQKYPLSKILLNNLFSIIDHQLEQFLDPIQIAQTNYPHITDSAIKKLYDQNNCFRQSIDYFIQEGLQNLQKITANNIKTIENPKNQQPTDVLNQLPLIFKTYVMNEAVRRAQYFYEFTYDIVLKDEHINNPITAFDVCDDTHQAITSSIAEHNYDFGGKYHSGKLVLWNLKTGKPIYTHGETNPICIVAFNPDGSQFAGIMYKENAIKIWCTETKQLLHNLPSPYPITNIAFSYPTGSLLTAVHKDCFGTIDDIRINQWLLTPAESKPGELINSCYYHSSYHFGGRKQQSGFSSDQYCASHPCTYLRTPKTELHVTKKVCDPLYLCIQAIHNSEDRSHISKLIESSASFHSLTDVEIKKVYYEMNRK